MPYKLSSNCVVKSDTGETVKCHDTHEQALAHLRALEANVSEAKTVDKAYTGMLMQSEVNYTPASIQLGKMCAGCRWFHASGDMMEDEPHCHLVEDEPQPILATGYCDRYEVSPAPMPDMQDVIVEAVSGAITDAVESVTGAITDALPTAPITAMDMGKEKKPSLFDKVRALVNPPRPDDAFSVFKGKDNEWHWHAIFTNNYEDLEGEILTEKAHDKYITRLDMGLVPMPELWAWHTPGTRHGEADAVWRNDHFVHAIGHFDDTPIAKKAIEFYRKNAGSLKMSHGFTAPEWAFDGKHYKDYNTIEITTLPPHAAANPYTSFEELKTMSWSDEKRRYVEALAGKDKVAEIEAADEQRSKALEDLKVAYKDHADATPTKTEPIQDEPVRKAYMDLVEAQNEQFGVIQLMSKALVAKDAQIAALDTKFEAQTQAWMKELNDLRAIVNQPPRRPSQDVQTVVKETDNLHDALPNGKTGDDFWTSLGVPLKGNA